MTYLTQAEAEADGLYKIEGNQVYFGVDNTHVISPTGPGRNSVRLQSNTAYNNALIIGDFAHMPGSDCGIWPALYVFYRMCSVIIVLAASFQTLGRLLTTFACLCCHVEFDQCPSQMKGNADSHTAGLLVPIGLQEARSISVGVSSFPDVKKMGLLNNHLPKLVEGVNIGVQDQMTLHTSPGCTVKVGTQGQTGMSHSNVLLAPIASTNDRTNMLIPI